MSFKGWYDRALHAAVDQHHQECLVQDRPEVFRGTVGDVRETVGGAAARSKVFLGLIQPHTVWKLVLLYIDRGDDRIHVDVLGCDACLCTGHVKLRQEHGAFVRIPRHSLGSPEQGHHACAVLAGQRYQGLHPLRPGHDRVDDGLPLLRLIHLQAGLDRIHIARVEKEWQVGDLLDGPNDPLHEFGPTLPGRSDVQVDEVDPSLGLLLCHLTDRTRIPVLHGGPERL